MDAHRRGDSATLTGCLFVCTCWSVALRCIGAPRVGAQLFFRSLLPVGAHMHAPACSHLPLGSTCGRGAYGATSYLIVRRCGVVQFIAVCVVGADREKGRGHSRSRSGYGSVSLHIPPLTQPLRGVRKWWPAPPRRTPVSIASHCCHTAHRGIDRSPVRRAHWLLRPLSFGTIATASILRSESA